MMWKTITAIQATDGNIIWRMCFACWINMATDTHLSYFIVIAFPRQQWLREKRLNITLYVHCESCFMYSLQATHTEANKLNLLNPYCQVTGKKFSEYRTAISYLSWSKHRQIPLHYTS